MIQTPAMREDQANAELFLYRRLGKRVVVLTKKDTKERETIQFGIVEYTSMTRTGGRGKWRRVWHATYEDGGGDDLNWSQLLDAFRIYGVWAEERRVAGHEVVTHGANRSTGAGL